MVKRLQETLQTAGTDGAPLCRVDPLYGSHVRRACYLSMMSHSNIQLFPFCAEPPLVRYEMRCTPAEEC